MTAMNTTPTKYIFVTGGVVSSLGKGIAAASIGRLLAARGEVEASQELFDRALDALRSRRRPYLEARVRFAYGQSMRRAGKRRLASRVLRSARELYASLGAQTYVSRCDRELKAAGANALVPAADGVPPR